MLCQSLIDFKGNLICSCRYENKPEIGFRVMRLQRPCSILMQFPVSPSFILTELRYQVSTEIPYSFHSFLGVTHLLEGWGLMGLLVIICVDKTVSETPVNHFSLRTKYVETTQVKHIRQLNIMHSLP